MTHKTNSKSVIKYALKNVHRSRRLNAGQLLLTDQFNETLGPNLHGPQRSEETQ